jgi:DNA-binding transcriptional MerR regulator
MPELRYSFKEMCAHFDVTPRTLRHYEYIELLFPERVGRARFYNRGQVVRMKLILQGRKFGFSLEDVRQWLMLYDTDPENLAQTQAWIDMATAQIVELEDRRALLDDAITELRRLKDYSAASLQRGTPAL